MKIKYLFLILAALNFVSCDNYLDTTPDNRTTLDSPEKVSELLVNAYPQIGCSKICFSMSDNAADKGTSNADLLNKEAYNWGEFTYTNTDSPEMYWTYCYNAIAHCNQALEMINSKFVTGTGETKVIDPQYAAYYGEALVARAYSHFMLVNLWGKTYDPTTANSDLGVPYVTEPEDVVLKQYKRETVETVYANIEKDLLEGLPYIDDNAYEVAKYHFNKDAAYAFASRFYLMKSDWAKVIQYSNLVLGNDPTSKLRDLNGAYTKMSLQEQEAQYNKADEPSVLLLSSTISRWFNLFFATSRYSMTDELQRLIFIKTFVDGVWNLPQAAYGTEHKLMSKYTYFFKRTSLNATTGWYYVMQPLFSSEEVLLNRAEAYAMLNKDDEAIQDINFLLSKKIKDYDPEKHLASTTNIENFYKESQANYNLNPFYNESIKNRSLLNCIIDLRRKEFYYEGHRWFDIRRFNMKVVHNINGSNPIELSGNDLRKQLQIPESALSYGIEKNPR